MKTMAILKSEAGTGVVIRYKDFVLATRFVVDSYSEGFEVSVWQPVETEAGTRKGFEDLRLENITEWEECFRTEGEALRAAMQFIEWKF